MSRKLNNQQSIYYIKVLNTLSDRSCITHSELFKYNKSGLLDINAAQRILIARELQESAMKNKQT